MFIRRYSPPAEESALSHPTYRRLLSAQIVALIGTGLTTIALTLLAYDLAGQDAGAVVGIALALKMVAYVVVSPVLVAFIQHLPRRRVLVALDLLRAATVAAMPFVDAVWQVYVLIFVLNACSGGFTPTFQATIPDVLHNEVAYTRALSLSRLAYELESLLSPTLAAGLLLVMSYNALFVANGAAFLISAALVLSVALPPRRATPAASSTWDRLTRGTRRYLATPRLRGLLALDLAVAAASAMVIVNTVVYVRDTLGRDDSDVAWALGASGGGAMIAAIALPALLERIRDRSVMLGGAALLVVGLALATMINGLAALLAIWLLLGVGLSIVQTPAGRLLQRSAEPEDRPALFSAQFSLSHACWLLTYPIAGLLGVALGLPATAAVLAAVAAAALAAAAILWPADDRDPSARSDLPRQRVTA